jgi:hypothetical protein
VSRTRVGTGFLRTIIPLDQVGSSFIADSIGRARLWWHAAAVTLSGVDVAFELPIGLLVLMALVVVAVALLSVRNR